MPDALLSKSNHTYLQCNDHSWDSENCPLEMAFGTRYCGAQGLLLLTWCLWLMVWHDHTENLGLKGGCRPVPAFITDSFIRPVFIDLAEILLFEESGWYSSWPHKRKIVCWTFVYIHSSPLRCIGAKPCCWKGTSGGRQDAVWRQNSVAAGSCSRRSHSI